MTDILRLTVSTPTGPFTLAEMNGAIVEGYWGEAGAQHSPLLDEAARQLDAYFARELEQFELALAPAGSKIARRYFAAMSAIPFGQTRTYGEMAAELGISAQAAGQLCGANPIAIIIPCHRVLGAANLGGFSGAGGVDTKVSLLLHEGAAGLLI